MEDKAKTERLLKKLVAEAGCSAIVLHLAAIYGWNARWMRGDKLERSTKVARLLAEAYDLIASIEAEYREAAKQ